MFEHNLFSVSVNLRVREGGDPVGEDGGIFRVINFNINEILSILKRKQDGMPPKEVPAGLGLLLPGTAVCRGVPG
jgi:hypothetical protein